jgi:hypothetical protein
MDNKELEHIGVLGMHWGIRKSHADRIAARPSKLFNTPSDIARGSQRIEREHKFNLAVKNKLITKPQKKAKELSNKELDAFVKGPVMQQKLSQIDARNRKRGKIAVAALLVLYGAYKVAEIKALSSY